MNGSAQSSYESDGYRLGRNFKASSRYVQRCRIKTWQKDSSDQHFLSLNLQHYLWKDVFGFNINPRIPVSDNASLRIADIGTGTGYADFRKMVGSRMLTSVVSGLLTSIATCLQYS